MNSKKRQVQALLCIVVMGLVLGGCVKKNKVVAVEPEPAGEEVLTSSESTEVQGKVEEKKWYEIELERTGPPEQPEKMFTLEDLDYILDETEKGNEHDYKTMYSGVDVWNPIAGGYTNVIGQIRDKIAPKELSFWGGGGFTHI